MVMGEMVLYLHDLRPASPTHRLSVLLRLQAEDLHLAVVPVGVAHGFYFPEPACLVYSVSDYFDGSDEFGCRWDAPELGVAWPCDAPVLSDRDRNAGSYAEMISALGL
jgi:dTDP-4-dehydrorhamnose 3,5-epimerase